MAPNGKVGDLYPMRMNVHTQQDERGIFDAPSVESGCFRRCSRGVIGGEAFEADLIRVA